jgi:hypothetical protein
MTALPLAGYVLWSVVTVLALSAKDDPVGDRRPIAWQSRVGWMGTMALVGCLFGAVHLFPVVLVGGLICAFAPKVGPDQRYLWMGD